MHLQLQLRSSVIEHGFGEVSCGPRRMSLRTRDGTDEYPVDQQQELVGGIRGRGVLGRFEFALERAWRRSL
jgi:hypothetical protein